MKDEFHHRQIFDKGFGQKSHGAMIRYLDEHKLSFHELDRVIKVGEETVAEWEGVFELQDGHVWLLECKHCITTDLIVAQPYRLEKTMMALGKPIASGKGFLAGRYWKTTKEVDTKHVAQKQGCGILFEKGDDLLVVR